MECSQLTSFNDFQLEMQSLFNYLKGTGIIPINVKFHYSKEILDCDVR